MKKHLYLGLTVIVSGLLLNAPAGASQQKIQFQNKLDQNVTFTPIYNFSFNRNSTLAFGRGIPDALKSVQVNAGQIKEYPALIFSKTHEGQQIKHPLLKKKDKTPEDGIKVLSTDEVLWGIYPISIEKGFEGNNLNGETAPLKYKVNFTTPIKGLSSINCLSALDLTGKTQGEQRLVVTMLSGDPRCSTLSLN